MRACQFEMVNFAVQQKRAKRLFGNHHDNSAAAHRPNTRHHPHPSHHRRGHAAAATTTNSSSRRGAAAAASSAARPIYRSDDSDPDVELVQSSSDNDSDWQSGRRGGRGYRLDGGHLDSMDEDEYDEDEYDDDDDDDADSLESAEDSDGEFRPRSRRLKSKSRTRSKAKAKAKAKQQRARSPSKRKRRGRVISLSSGSDSGSETADEDLLPMPGGRKPTDDDFVPSPWITRTTPVLAPYSPQMGDRVIYCKQGHREYVEAVREANLFRIRSDHIPFQGTKFALDPAERMEVVAIKYLVGPPRRCRITLRSVDEYRDHVTFTVDYHDFGVC